MQAVGAMTEMPMAGATAPAFTLAAPGGSTVSLADDRDKKTVVVSCYPKDGSLLCTDAFTSQLRSRTHVARALGLIRMLGN